MALRGHIRYKGAPDVLLKELRPIIKQTLQDMCTHWHQNDMPRHFTDSGRRLYGYRKRTDTYLKRKRRKYGHQRPLEWSGDTKRQAQRARPSGTHRRARVSMSLPWYTLKQFRGQATIADELTKLTKNEIQTMARDFQGLVEVRLMAVKKETVKR